jgi:hypothetical protein
MPARSTARDLVRDVGLGEEAFDGEVIVTDEACTVLARAHPSVRGEFAVIVRVPDIDVRTGNSPYGELHPPGYRVLEGTYRDVRCPLTTG